VHQAQTTHHPRGRASPAAGAWSGVGTEPADASAAGCRHRLGEAWSDVHPDHHRPRLRSVPRRPLRFVQCVAGPRHWSAPATPLPRWSPTTALWRSARAAATPRSPWSGRTSAEQSPAAGQVRSGRGRYGRRQLRPGRVPRSRVVLPIPAHPCARGADRSPRRRAPGPPAPLDRARGEHEREDQPSVSLRVCDTRSHRCESVRRITGDSCSGTGPLVPSCEAGLG
jgi:hypothetical protein